MEWNKRLLQKENYMNMNMNLSIFEVQLLHNKISINRARYFIDPKESSIYDVGKILAII